MSKFINDFLSDYEYPVCNAWVLLVNYMLEYPMECVYLDHKLYRYNPDFDSFESADPLHNKPEFSTNGRLTHIAKKNNLF